MANCTNCGKPISDCKCDGVPLELPQLRYNTASDILQSGIDAMLDRAASRDNAETGERSMSRAVALMHAYNGGALTTEQDGWIFMVFLKLARHKSGTADNLDDFIDGAAYMALAGETLKK